MSVDHDYVGNCYDCGCWIREDEFQIAPLGEEEIAVCLHCYDKRCDSEHEKNHERQNEPRLQGVKR